MSTAAISEEHISLVENAKSIPVNTTPDHHSFRLSGVRGVKIGRPTWHLLSALKAVMPKLILAPVGAAAMEFDRREPDSRGS